jgi:glycine betaine/proline transport system ATP-binding protein
VIETRELTKVYGPPPRRMLHRAAPGRAGTGSPGNRRVGGVLAVDGVSFDVQRGELFAIMGLSGSGKSTMLRMINRLVEPTSGTVRIAGADIGKMAPAELRTLRNHTISMVFQHFALLPHRSVRENAAFGLHLGGVPVRERLERAEWALSRVGLADRGDALPHELSGGMKQRVGLARALATDADILLMDEPFSALDPLIRRDMQDLLLQLQAEDQRTIVFVTHDLNEAMRIGQRIMVMKDGGVVQCGTGTEILTAPADAYVSEFVADVDRSRVLTASAVMQPPRLTALAGDSPGDVLGRLEDAHADGAYVLDERRRVVGVVRAADLARAVRDGAVSVADCLEGDWVRVRPDSPLAEICHLSGRHIVPMAVVDKESRLLGVVPRAAILSALASPQKAEEYA